MNMIRRCILFAVAFTIIVASVEGAQLMSVSLGTMYNSGSTVGSSIDGGTQNAVMCTSTTTTYGGYTASAITTSAASDTAGNAYFTFRVILNSALGWADCPGVYKIAGGTGLAGNLVTGTESCYTVWGAFVGSVWRVYCISGAGVIPIS